MQDIRIVNESRRNLLKGGAALTLALYLPAIGGCASEVAKGGGPLAPNAFLRVGADDTVTVIAKHNEMGQGAYTGLATLVADELDADWAQVRVEAAPADAKRYANLAFGMQGTGGSSSTANSFEQYRQAGATARAMLVTAAAKEWGVAAGDIRVEQGVLKSGSRSLRFGELVGAAAQLPVPDKVALKDPARFTLIGKSAARVDAVAKSNGTAIFTQDFKLPGMLTAVVARPPRFGAKVKSFDASKAKAIPGVLQVVAYETPLVSGVAVLAKGFWAARQGRDALTVEWDDSTAASKGSPAIYAEYHKLAAGQGKVARNDGDAGKALAGAAHRLEASYQVPYLSHAQMEPLNCVARIDANGCEIWNGDQFQTFDQLGVAQLLGLKPEQVKINTLYAGGSFGRRANPLADYVVECAAIARAAKTDAAVKMVWTREEDMRAGFYRPAYVHAVQAGLDAKGQVTAWRQHIVGQSIMAHTPLEKFTIKDGIDSTSVEGASTLPYDIPNLKVELTTTETGVPVQWWRSVGSTHTAFVTECFLDELARAAHKDPLEFRRALLQKSPRHLAVLELAAQKGGWGSALPPGHARGIAVHESFNTVVAEVVEISRGPKGLHIERVVAAVDCGLAVNPNIVAMQVESSICYGLSAALAGEIPIEGGAAQVSNFNGYPVVRMNQMPLVEVHILPSANKPTGIGEPGLPPLAPALCNALLALTGKPVRSLPLSAQGIHFI
jgi:isoquinoline 1-oxidoreductase beta subunit